MTLQITFQCVRLSQCAYRSNRDAIRAGEALGAIHVCPFSVSTTQGLIAEFSDYVIVAFRGTDSEDILTDLWMRRVAGPVGYVHAGFLSYTSKVVEVLRSRIGTMSSVVGHKPIYFTGHSLGGAAAQLAAVLLGAGSPRPLKNRIAGVVSFGSPRVGDARFAWALDQLVEHHRWVNANDIVAYVPWLLGTYRHSGTLHYITRDKKVWRKPNPLAVFLDRWGGCRRGVLRWASDKVRDHRVRHYVDAVSREYAHELNAQASCQGLLNNSDSLPVVARFPTGESRQGGWLASVRGRV